MRCAAIAAIQLFAATTVLADSNHDVVLFGSVDTFDNRFSNPPAVAEDDFVRPSLDILYTYSGEKFRFLGEYLWSSTESEMERLKVGWQAGTNTMVWFGRFHSTSKYWTNEYHHGQFMQTPITRPSVEEWEDESGPMPSHLTGLSIEQERELSGERALNWAFSLGLAPKFESQQLHAFDVLEPESGHGLGTNLRLVYRPEVLEENQVGLLLGFSDINVESDSHPNLADLDQIAQTTIGVFSDWRWREWRFIANAIYFDNRMTYVDRKSIDRFTATYLQVEYKVNDDWTAFGRTDNAFEEDNSPYLRLLPAFIAHRNMLGARWDFLPFQSLTAEFGVTSAQGESLSHNNFQEIRLQWSGVFR